jgi:hypothetical protein
MRSNKAINKQETDETETAKTAEAGPAFKIDDCRKIEQSLDKPNSSSRRRNN